MEQALRKPTRSGSVPLHCILGVSLVFVLLENVVNIGRNPLDQTKLYLVGRLSPLDLALALIAYWGMVNWGAFARKYVTLPIVVALAIVVFSSVAGLIRYGYSASYVLFDIRICLSFFCGI